MNVSRTAPIVGAARRRGAPLSGSDLVAEGTLPGCGGLPLLLEPKAEGVRLSAWAKGRRAQIEALVARHGAVLLRGFALDSVAEFEACVDELCGGALEYRFRASPRTEIGRHVYTATDYPAEQSIFPHNEHSYSPVCPLYLAFFSESPAPEGGETPLGDNREVTRRIDPAIKERFREKGVLYVRNYEAGVGGAGFGLPWPIVFQADDKGAVERFCDGIGVEWTWKSHDRLCTRQVGPALIRHPRTGEEIWFNHATFFHVTTLPQALRDALLAEFDENDLPTQTFYGDGAPIEPETLEHLRAVYRDALVAFPWKQKDVLILDNILTVHARNPYRGPRRVLVAMAQTFKPRDFAAHAGATP
ncbi:TauD/TfdA family dioxygenase [Methylocapsa acidiphila]|uniref:TauD/TfdA family dioxygenase n=1 Tax=Methylocapsa acidiphila TaxID=133552 RepID=UPI00040F4DDA|nr:TauD/TfdA family dioxygenase [Methylocapsa acidiphila]